MANKKNGWNLNEKRRNIKKYSRHFLNFKRLCWMRSPPFCKKQICFFCCCNIYNVFCDNADFPIEIWSNIFNCLHAHIRLFKQILKACISSEFLMYSTRVFYACLLMNKAWCHEEISYNCYANSLNLIILFTKREIREKI